MRVAYVSQFDPNDPTVWSGTVYNMARSLELGRMDVERVGPIEVEAPLSTRLAAAWNIRVQKSTHYQTERHPGLLKAMAKETERELADREWDLILSPGTLPLAYLRTDAPVAIWSDCTFACMHNFYPDYKNLPESTVRDGNDADRRAFERADALIFASQWAADSAVDAYGIDRAKTHIVPLGANVEPSMEREDVMAAIDARPTDECRLIFVGKRWERKRGALAVDIARILNDYGLKTTITLVGTDPPEGWPVPDFCEVVGFVDKSTPEGKAHFEALLSESHFLVVPSDAEAFGLVYAEANCYGVPAIGCRVGGVQDVVRDGVNGMTFEVDAKSSAYADWIKSCFTHRDRYTRLAQAAYKEYTNRLNWSTAGAHVREVLESISG
jgi:glycosyltransferase involved in cell wall biosynthesis